MCRNPDAIALPFIVLALLVAQYISALPGVWQSDRNHSTIVMEPNSLPEAVDVAISSFVRCWR